MRIGTYLAAMLAAFASTVVMASQQSPTEKPQTPGRGSELTVQLPSPGQQSPAAKFTVTVAPATAGDGEIVTMTINATVAPGWHVNSVNMPKEAVGLATTIEVKSAGLEAIDKAFVPSTPPIKLVVGEATQFCHAGTFSWTRKYRVGKDGLKAINGLIRFQACDDEKCLPPTKLSFALSPDKVTMPKSSPTTAKLAARPIGRPLVVELEKCRTTRPKAKLSLLGVLFGGRNETLVLKGEFKHEGKGVAIYLPRSRKYSLTNSGMGNSRVQNSATYISIDQDGDGKILESESYGANRPFRVGDAMYQITSIDKENQKLTVQQVAANLSGTVLGRKVPPFKLTTVDGRQITDKSILGKVTLLDVWAVT